MTVPRIVFFSLLTYFGVLTWLICRYMPSTDSRQEQVCDRCGSYLEPGIKQCHAYGCWDNNPLLTK
jgi:hypothetical protein